MKEVAMPAAAALGAASIPEDHDGGRRSSDLVGSLRLFLVNALRAGQGLEIR
jgi:hypothetical protein